MRVDPFSLTRPRPVVPESKEFIDPAHPDIKIRIALKPLTAAESYAAVDVAEPYIEDYVTGNEIERKLPSPGLPVDGKIVPMTKKLIYDMATLQLMQCPEREDDRYTVEELVAFSEVAPTFFDDLMKFADDVKKKARNAEKNACGVAAETASPSPSGISSDIHTSMPESSLSSGASMSD